MWRLPRQRTPWHTCDAWLWVRAPAPAPPPPSPPPCSPSRTLPMPRGVRSRPAGGPAAPPGTTDSMGAWACPHDGAAPMGADSPGWLAPPHARVLGRARRQQPLPGAAPRRAVLAAADWLQEAQPGWDWPQSIRDPACRGRRARPICRRRRRGALPASACEGQHGGLRPPSPHPSCPSPLQGGGFAPPPASRTLAMAAAVPFTSAPAPRSLPAAHI